jgi:nucleoside-diphosphate kinase
MIIGVNMEKAFVLIKPDGVQAGRHYVDDEAWLEDVGRKSIATYEAKGIKTSEKPVEIGHRIRGYLMDYITAGPVVAMVLEGNEAIDIVRKIVGSTAPYKADPSTIRGRYASDSYSLADERKRPVHNLIHTSDSPETAKREIGIWFDNSEIKEYERADESAMFG